MDPHEFEAGHQRQQEALHMGFGDKIENKAEDAKGKVKEGVGDATDNESLEAEGKADQTNASVKQAGEHVKDAAGDVKDAFKK
jgi:uncharacterized protein YjbJ (UPF0337 family)